LRPYGTEPLAAVITLEQGKTLADARGDVFRGLEVVEQACGRALHYPPFQLHHFRGGAP